jgi:hypothetical protein
VSSRGFANWAVRAFAGDTPIIKMAVDGCFNLAEKRAAAKATAEREAAEAAEKLAFLEAVAIFNAQIQTPAGELRLQALLEYFGNQVPEEASSEEFHQEVVRLLVQELLTPSGRAWVREFFAASPEDVTSSGSAPLHEELLHSPEQNTVSQPTPALQDVIYCSSCGLASNRDARFCGRCGGQLRSTQPPPATSIAPPAPPPDSPGRVQTAGTVQSSPARSRSIFRKFFVGIGIAAAGLLALTIGLTVLGTLVSKGTSTTTSAPAELPATAASADDDATRKAKQEAVSSTDSWNPWAAYLGNSAQYHREDAASGLDNWFKLRKLGTNAYALEFHSVDGPNTITFNTEPTVATLTDNVLSFTEPASSCAVTITFAESEATVTTSRECTMGEVLNGSYSRTPEEK